MKQRSLLLRLHNESSLKSEASNSFDMIRPHRSDDVISMSPILAKVSPIVDYHNIEVDVQSSTENENDGSSALTDDIEDDWSFGDGDECDDLYQDLTPLTSDLRPNSLYSFYFEDTHTRTPEDDMSMSLDDDVSFGGSDSLLDGNNEGTVAIWSASPPPLVFSHERRLSPAQVSLSSLDFGELQHASSI